MRIWPFRYIPTVILNLVLFLQILRMRRYVLGWVTLICMESAQRKALSNPLVITAKQNVISTKDHASATVLQKTGFAKRSKDNAECEVLSMVICKSRSVVNFKKQGTEIRTLL